MSKKCTQLWREAHFEVKMYKIPQCRTTFASRDVQNALPLWCEARFHFKCLMHNMFRPLLDFQMSFCVASTNDFAPCQECEKREGFVAVSTFHYTTLHYTIQIHYATLRYTTPHYTTLIALHRATLHYTLLHYTTLHYTTALY